MPTTVKPTLLRRVLPRPLLGRLPAGLVREYVDRPVGTRLRVITVLTPVPDAAVPGLRITLDELSEDQSPFLQVPGTHFARLALMAAGDFRPQRRPDRSRMALRARLLHLLMHRGQEQEPDRRTPRTCCSRPATTARAAAPRPTRRTTPSSCAPAWASSPTRSGASASTTRAARTARRSPPS